MTPHLLLLVGALICFGCDVARVPTTINLTALGLFLWCASGLA